jgi:hypothetical protein
MSGFRFRVEKTFSIPGRGVVVSGKVEEGKVAVEQVIGFLETTGQWKNGVVMAIEVEHQLVEEAEAGQQASLLLDGVKKNQIAIGTVFLEPPQGPVSKEAYQPESGSEPAVSTRTPAGPRIFAPGEISSGRPIQPASGSWRLAFLILAGLLIILLLLFFQGKLDPLKKRVEIHPDQVGTMARFLPVWDHCTLRQTAGVMFFPIKFF